MIEIKNVTKRYGNKEAIKNVSFNVNDGEIFAFIGHNGAGKTTLIKAIVGIHKFDEGDILINDKSIIKDPIICKKQMAFVPDNPELYEKMKVVPEEMFSKLGRPEAAKYTVKTKKPTAKYAVGFKTLKDVFVV